MREREGWNRAFAPATVANLGSGFDAFAVALCAVSRGNGGSSERRVPLGDRVSVRRTRRPGVKVSAISGDAGRLPKSAAKNCAAVAAAGVLRAARVRFGLELVLEKGLPLSSGLGSSAASAAAGAFAAALALASEVDKAAAAWGRRAKRTAGRAASGTAAIDKRALIGPALSGEHVADGSWHGDNVWASLLGGAVIVVSTRPAEIVPLTSPRSITWVTVHPRYELPTRRARAVLPKRVSLGDAAAQAGQFGALVAAWREGDRSGIGRGLKDRLAEPHRARLVPGYAAALRAGLRAGAYGLTFAGAGPSVLAVTEDGQEEAVGEAIRAAFGRAGLEATVLICAVDPEGARVAPE